MRWISGVFLVVFLVAAAVQTNDPDPTPWIAAYLVAACVAASGLLARARCVPCLFAALGFGLAFARFAPTLAGAPAAAFASFEMQATEHEEPREAMGLALAATYCLGLGLYARRRAGRDPVDREE
ncbi:MAG: transmembrane 220 family protein [Myxococcota bacterium]